LTAVGITALVPLFAFAGTAGARHASGLRGLVLEGPTSPVCHTDDSCEAPARRVLLQFRRAGKMIEVRTTRSGTYSVRLRAGSYVVTTPRRRVGTGLTPRVVRVPRGRVVRVDFHLDTGIQ
jgi:hypothetical protein